MLTRAIVLSRAPGGDRIAEAASLLEQLLPSLPADLPSASQARRLLIALNLQLGRPAIAAKAAAVEASQQADAPNLRLYVDTLIAAGSLTDAERLISQLEKMEPGQPANLLLKARLLGAQKQPAKAAELLEPQVQVWLESEQPFEKIRGFVREATRLLVSMDQIQSAERIAQARRTFPAGQEPGRRRSGPRKTPGRGGSDTRGRRADR